jgi:hypothetical protein
MVVSGAIPAGGARFESLELQLDRGLTEDEIEAFGEALGLLGLPRDGILDRTEAGSVTWRALCSAVAHALSARFRRFG